MKKMHRLISLLLLLLLVGCKSELYTKLDEGEANQMLALLIYNHIPADKVTSKEGVTILVEQERFLDAIEVLRHNGLPRRKSITMEDIFPSGQLVTSPEQEEAKLNYFHSQQLEDMLNNMDGVITANVSIAEPRSVEGEDPAPTSAAVFIKYSPDANLPAREAEIRALIRNGIQGLTPERISITMQRSDYRYQINPPAERNHFADSLLSKKIPWASVIAAVVILLCGVMVVLIYLFRRRRSAG